MSEKLSERAARIGGFWLVEFAPEIAALEQQLVVAQMEEDVLGQRVAVLSADLAAKDAEIARLRKALSRIAKAYEFDCGCDHNTPDCCDNVSESCAKCMAEIALAETPAAPKEMK